MKLAHRQYVIAAVLLVLTSVTVFAQTDPLPSWNEGKSKKSIMEFVAKESSTVTKSLSGKRWRLREVNGMAVESTRAYLEFDSKANRFSGDGGCNRIAGNFTLSGAQIRFAQVISTKRACLDGDIQKVESDLLKGLEEVTRFKIKNGVLRLMNGDRTVLSFSVDSKQ